MTMQGEHKRLGAVTTFHRAQRSLLASAMQIRCLHCCCDPEANQVQVPHMAGMCMPGWQCPVIAPQPYPPPRQAGQLLQASA